MSRRSAQLRLAGVLGAAALLSACSAIPADTIGTLDRATGGTLVVGVSEHAPWTEVSETGEVSGSEADLIRSFAADIGAEVAWHPAPESILASRIAEDELDIVIGGFTDASPWADYMALTRPYATVDEENMVMGLRLGENALMMALERHLAEEHGEI